MRQRLPHDPPNRPSLSFVIAATVGTAGAPVGLGGDEFRLPALVGALRFSAREAVAVNLVARMPTIAVGLLRHFGPASVLRHGAVWRATILPLGAVLGATTLGFVPDRALKIGLGIILIWSARGVFRHLPKAEQAWSGQWACRRRADGPDFLRRRP